jgi:hypothetical protein
MDKELMDQLQDLIDSLQVAKSQAQQVAQTMRKRRLDLGLDHNYPDAEITHLINKARRLRLLAENGE